MIRLLSFGYRTKRIPDAAFVFDCRGLTNPHQNPALRDLDGRSREVQEFVRADPGFQKLYGEAQFRAIAFSKPVIAFGCFGGQHRSVAVVEMLAEELRARGQVVEVKHRELLAT